MAFGKKDEKIKTLQDDKEYVGVCGQQKVIPVNLVSYDNNLKSNLEKLNNYLANDWEFIRVDEDRNGTMYYLIEKE